jgi:hypothetical protein
VKAPVVRQPKKVYGEMIVMGAKSITIVRAVTADFFFDCRAAEVLKWRRKQVLCLRSLRILHLMSSASLWQALTDLPGASKA